MKIDKKLINSVYFNEALENLKKVLAIASEQGPPVKGAIFGKETREALEFTLNLAKKWGLKTYIESEGHYGFLEYGKGTDIFLIAPHLDVVTAANHEKWNNPPFSPTIIDNKLYARGSFDDKGPAYMSLYALKYLIDQNWKPNNYTIRIVFGLDEEKQMRCLKKYVQDFGPPTLGFTPDGAFPCIYAEKAICDVNLTGNFKCDFTIKKPSKTNDYNVVVDYVIYNGKHYKEIQNFLELNKIESKIIKNELHIFGKPAHGSMPELGQNAALWLIKAMYSIGIEHPIIEFGYKYLCPNFNLTEIIGDLTDESGPLTSNLGYIDLDNEKFIIGLNNRVPVTHLDQKDLIAPLEEKANKYGIRVSIKNSLPPIYFRKDRNIVKKMVQVYKNVTNKDVEPIAMGGGTYAKVVPNLIACGIAEGFENVTPHQYNEWIGIENLKRALEIYANLIVELTK